MQIILDIPDGQAAAIVEGVCIATGWTPSAGQDQAAWAKDALVKFVKDTAKRGQLKQLMGSIATSIDPVNIT